MREVRGLFVVLSALALVVAGCGGGTRQDKGEPSGTFNVQVTEAKFPAKQSLSQHTKLVIGVKNADQKTIPNVAVTIETVGQGTSAQAFAEKSTQPDLQDPSRPIWVVDDGPVGGITAYSNTWALGPLKSGQEKKFIWDVTSVKPGDFKIQYTVAAGLNGKAHARMVGGGLARNTFSVHVTGKPALATVDDNGNVVRQPQY